MVEGNKYNVMNCSYSLIPTPTDTYYEGFAESIDERDDITVKWSNILAQDEISEV